MKLRRKQWWLLFIVIYSGVLSCILSVLTSNGVSCEYQRAKSIRDHLRNCWVGTTNTAGIYFRSQRPHFRAAARGYNLHWAFAQAAAPASTRVSYEDMVIRRFSSMTRNMEKWGRSDAMIEKDKCVMYRFFGRNGIKFAPILYDSFNRSLDAFVNDIRSGHVFANVSSFPIFFKACHLTIGSIDGVLRVKNRSRTDQGWRYKAKSAHNGDLISTDEDLVKWVSTKWSTKAIDAGRPWEKAASALTEHLKPDFILQGPAKLSYVPERNIWMMFEIKTYVLWGRAFLGMVITDNDIPNSLVIRGQQDLDMELLPANGVSSLLYLHRFSSRHPDFQWLVDEGHGACVWPLAGAVAKAMRIDEVRIDIFVTRGSPKSCMVNEMSLSSGLGQGPFRDYIAKLWAEPHITRSFNVWGSATSKPVYMLGSGD